MTSQELNEPYVDLPIPEIEDARIEYIYDLPFDDRIEQVLTLVQHDLTRFEFDNETLFVVDPEIIPQSHSFEENGVDQQTTRLKVEGAFYDGIDGPNFNAKLIRDTYYDMPALLIRNNDGNFEFSKGKSLRKLDPIDAAKIILRATGTDSTILDGLIEKRIISSELCFELIKKSLVRAAELSGTSTCVKTAEITADDSTPDTPTIIRYGHISRENVSESNLRIIIERVILHPTLDAEEVYRLVLNYTHPNENEPSGGEDIDITAEKVVRGDGFTLQSKDFIYKDATGKKTKLNPLQPGVADMFVEAFEELFTASVHAN